MHCIGEQTLRGLMINITTLASLSTHELWQWHAASAKVYLLEAPALIADIRQPRRGQISRCMVAIANLIGNVFYGQSRMNGIGESGRVNVRLHVAL